MSDWLDEVLGWENGKPDPQTGAGPGEKKHDGADKANRHALTTVPPVQALSTTRGAPFPPGSAHGEQAQDEPHKPMTARAVTDSDSTETSSDKEDPSSPASPLKERMHAVAQKALRARDGVAKVWTSTAPTREKVSEARESMSVRTTGRWSFLWAAGAGWLVGFQIILALYDRIVLLFSLTFMPRSQYLSEGGKATEWGFLEGPARWTKDTMAFAWENGQTGRVVAAVLIGVLPLIGARVAEVFSGSPRLKKWALIVVYGVPAAWISFKYYVPTMGYHAWWEVQLTTLTALAWWGWQMSKGRETGFTTFLMRIPMAALITGAVAYSPGAAF